MSSAWALAAPCSSATAIARLPRYGSIAICDRQPDLWLRGPSLTSDLETELARIPSARGFRVLADGQLIPQGRLVPDGRLPDGPWQLLSDWLNEALALPSVIQSHPEAIAFVPAETLRLVPSGAVRPSLLLETTLASFCSYVATAPQWRIDRWNFAASGEGSVLVRGAPLPPLPGVQWTGDQGVLVPAGHAWQPPVPADVVRQALNLNAGELALLRPEGGWQRITEECWVRCTRSAVRLSLEAARA